MSRTQFQTITRLRTNNDRLRKIIKKKNRRIFELEDQLLGRCQCQERTIESQIRNEQEIEREEQVIRGGDKDIDHPHIRYLGINN